ncbi:STAS domain-containing protein [Kineococcus sp. TRM81007]|uniref:STAS domain-containing protein n=1 Tax=Kineococcus sp. TRM81007 TaxID=2925831 RepID=UPI001F5652F8|nr:STAS domain-containing protein [Kineococcus sp. TRM81007]MCI2237534.1 STAS domain-containing protein [Kineococcus sp. TRM81007]
MPLPTVPASADRATGCGLAHLDLVLRPGPRGAPALLHASGELEAATADLLLGVVDSALQQGCIELEVDLADVTFCDVRGIDAVLTARAHLRAAGGELHLQQVQPFLRHVFRLLRLGEAVEG